MMIFEVLAVFLLLYLFYHGRFKTRSYYWAQRGVRQPRSNPFPFGNNPLTCWERLIGKTNVGTAAYQQYQEFVNEKIYGTYMLAGCDPVLMLRDPELIRDILVKDFDHFVDRGRPLFTTEGTTLNDLLWSRQLSRARGDEWKRLQSMFSPIFTPGKLLAIQNHVDNAIKEVEIELTKHIETGGQIELKKVFEKFSMDVMASSAFGIEAGSFREDDFESDFVSYAKALMTMDFRDSIRLVSDKVPILGFLLSWLEVPFIKPKETAFFYETVVYVLRQKMKLGFSRNDLIDLMIETITAGSSQGVDNPENSSNEFNQKSTFTAKKERKKFRGYVDELDIVATAIALLVAGFSTTAQTLTFAVYQLTLNPDIQRCLQEEIDSLMTENCFQLNDLDYSTIRNMTYLDMVICETLRLNTPSSIISRQCTKEYKLRGTKVTIMPGQHVQISVLGIHWDPEFYHDPLTFDPENFTEENKSKRSPCTFLAFGQGPRSCIGMQFALLVTKACLVRILSRFSF